MFPGYPLLVSRVGNCEACENGDSFGADAEQAHVSCSAFGAGVDTLADCACATVNLLYLSFIQVGGEV